MIRWLLLVILSVCLGRSLGAQILPKSCDPEDPKSCIQPLIMGEIAPFDGQLMTNRRAAKLSVLAGGCQDRIDLEVARERELTTIELNGEKALRASDQVGFNLQKDLLLKRMAEMEEILTPHWYERPAFVAATTVLMTMGIVAVSVKTLQILK